MTPDAAPFADWCDVWTASGLAERPDDPPRPWPSTSPRPGSCSSPAARALASSCAGRWSGTASSGPPGSCSRSRTTCRWRRWTWRCTPSTAGRGSGTALLAEAERLARERGRSTLISEVDEPGPDAAGRAFALRHGWSCDLVETRRDLLLPPDEARLTALEAQAREASRGYELVTWRDRTPDALVDDRALLERRMTTDAPHGDLPVEEEHWDAARVREYEAMHVDRGRTVLSAGAVRAGRLVAFTDLQVPLALPQRANQAGTLVLREHRGHRLGALVKAAVLRAARRDAGGPTRDHLQRRGQRADGGRQRGARVRAGGRAVVLVATARVLVRVIQGRRARVEQAGWTPAIARAAAPPACR